jgi:enoyl-CoA hydratase/carnithine racemase
MAAGGPFRPVDADTVAAAADPGSDPDLSRGQRMVLAFRTLPVPVIAAVHGPALGGGLQLALGAHLRIVAPDASLGMLEIRWGITPDMAGTQLLPRLVGPDVAAQLILGGDPVDGVEAVRIGLATRLADDPRAAALEFARTVAGRNPEAVRMAMRLLGVDSFAEGLAAEREGLRTVAGSPNQREAAAAALEGRAPVFVDP